MPREKTKKELIIYAGHLMKVSKSLNKTADYYEQRANRVLDRAERIDLYLKTEIGFKNKQQ